MSDNIEELSKAYRRNVSEEHSRSIGLFPIPEYTEYEVSSGMWSSALDVILTTLRYLAPATLLTIFWGPQSFLFKLLKYIDTAFRSLVCTSEEQKEVVLQWLETAGPVRVNKLETVWRHGWILCGVLDIALPGTCAGHPPTKLSLKHAQSIAEDYLGIEPVFTRQELESIETLGKHQEWKLITLLDNIRLAIAKLTPRPTKTSPIRFAAESSHHTFDYIAKGSGLVAAQIRTKTFFKIYPTAQQSLNPEDISIEIKGPKKSHGTYTIPPILGKAQIIRQSLLGRKATSNYTENILPITQGTSYLRNFGKNDMSKTYFIPKMKNNIDIETETHEDHVKVSYTVTFEGTYEISITSKNLCIAGSPFNMKASKNIVETLENDNFSLEDGEEIDIVDVSTDKKVILRIVDFGTEKMLLKENGCLETISMDKAKQLMAFDNKQEEGSINKDSKRTSPDSIDLSKRSTKNKCKYFSEAARKVMLMNRVCKHFWSYKKESQRIKHAEIRIRNQGIPDVVNSTLNDYNVNANLLPALRDRYIIPEQISVSLLTEKHNKTDSKNIDTQKTDDTDNYGPIYDDIFDNDTSFDTQNSVSNNPFDEAYLINYSTEKKYGSFIMSEYETNNSQNEETHTTIKLESEEDNKCEKSTNPFEEIVVLDSNSTVSDKKPINPFSDDSVSDDTSPESTTDFKIGAPVSLPPNLITTSTDSLNSENSNTSSDTASCDKPETENNESQESKQTSERNRSSEIQQGTVSPKKEMWDSAYVSIDENNSSDIKAHENIDEIYHNEKLSNIQRIPNLVSSIDSKLLEKTDTTQEKSYTECDGKKVKTEPNRLAFTTIQEENDRYEAVLNNTSESISKNETDSVTEAFAELDDIYDDYFSNNEKESNNKYKKTETVCVEIHRAPEYDGHVNSASDKATDVKRQTITQEGKTSEIQVNVTESVSASQILPKEGTDIEENNNIKHSDETQFGDKIYTNIVIEKKHYWDEKIKQIQAKEEELKNLSKRRLSSKYLRRNDSLTKRRGKQIVKNFLKSKEKEAESEISSDIIVQKSTGASFESTHNKARLKDSLRNYWDSRVHAMPSMDACFGKKTEKDKDNSKSKDIDSTVHIGEVMKTQDDCNLNKQDFSEKVFEAFETSPKRFFGTSRQHILNKIDTFLGKSEHDSVNKIDFTSEISQDSGLVSSRISLFHNITKTEPLPTSYRKHKSLNNIYTEKVSIDKNFILKEHPKSFECGGNSTSTQIGNVVNIDKNANLIKEPLVSFQVKKLEDSDKLKEENVNTSGNISNTINIDEHKNIDVAIDKEIDNDNFEKRQHISRTEYTDYGHSNNHSFMNNKLKSFSKSEMDIFSKTSTAIDIDFDKHKSYENLPTISVKKFVSLYEFVSKSSDQPKSLESNRKSKKFRGKISNESSTEGTAKEPQIETSSPKEGECETEKNSKILLNYKSFKSNNTSGSAGFEMISNEDKHRSCLSLSDIEIEIIENPDDTNDLDRLEPEGYTDYKNRFKMAKQYFKSLEELRIDKKPKEQKEHIVSVADIPEESLEPKDKKRKVNRSKIKKSHSMPSSELSKIWNQMQEETNNNPKKLMKISEKFNVEDLYEDVMDGRLSRQGSLRGIPNKKAVLETFRSMENVNVKNFNSYELATSHFADFENDNKVRNVQTYLSEYPYLPTTEPSKYHSRFDASASGLITFKELKELKEKRTFRRNSVPNAKINPIFTEDV